jgi:Protein of unknown function (DUF3455)
MKRALLLGAVAVQFALGAFSTVQADESPVAVPRGATQVWDVSASGIQAYTCEAKGSGYEWVFTGPEATLFDKQGRQVGTHFAGPSWKHADGSTIVGEGIGKMDAPAGGAIPWLLLRVKSHEGAGILAGVAYVRRIDTQGGVAPKSGCDSGHISEQARMRYTATYQFFSTTN